MRGLKRGSWPSATNILIERSRCIRHDCFIVLHVLLPNRLSGAPPPGKPSRWRPCDARVPGDTTETKTRENLWKSMENEAKKLYGNMNLINEY